MSSDKEQREQEDKNFMRTSTEITFGLLGGITIFVLSLNLVNSLNRSEYLELEVNRVQTEVEELKIDIDRFQQVDDLQQEIRKLKNYEARAVMLENDLRLASTSYNELKHMLSIREQQVFTLGANLEASVSHIN